MLHFQDVKLALAAYNMGPTAVKRLMDKGESVPQEYVERVLENYKALSQNASSVTETNSDGKSDKLKVAREEK
jgi:soluble lytic murein transglycosylase-like protein